MKPEFSILGRAHRFGAPKKPQRLEVMPSYKYLGKEVIRLAQVGIVKPDQVVTVSTEIGDALEKHDGPNWELMKTAPVVPVEAPAASEVAPPVADAPEKPKARK